MTRVVTSAWHSHRQGLAPIPKRDPNAEAAAEAALHNQDQLSFGMAGEDPKQYKLEL